MALATRIAGVPRSHLAMHKMAVNHPEGLWFGRSAQAEGFKAAVECRDSGRPIPKGDEARAQVRALQASCQP